mmetsp:Transcript_54402/g.124014  ORF Transcript_54402/g.124014 Transcript_54402/m.124014 type:complete len:212 (-) Transcript_54402:66-701(-)
MSAKFRNSGQTCVCPNRFLVHSSVHDLFVAKLSERIKASLRLGHGAEEGTTIGPLINAAGVAKVELHLRDALAKGAKVALGPEDFETAGGNFFPPTVLTSCGPGMLCFDEETFGPLVAIRSFESESDALEISNQADNCGLAGYLVSKDLARCFRVAQALKVGMVGVNEGAISTEVAPFGGVKQSGLGREGAREGLDEYLDTKYICLGGLDP